MKKIFFNGVETTHLDHSSFKIKKDGLVVYIDPYKIKDEPADYILITHDHYDHLDLESIDLLKTPETVFIVPEIVAKQFTGYVESLLPGENYRDQVLTVYTTPMHNMHHPKQKDYLGFIVEIDDVRIFHAGDTGPLDEIKSLSNIDIALIPIDGTFSMNEAEAAGLVRTFKPKIAVPMHYGEIPGGGDPKLFEELVNSAVEVKILE